MRPAPLLALALACALGCGSNGTSDPGETPPPGAEDGPRVHGLTPAEAAAVLARVGERTITVGDFAEELASRGAFVRTRYETPERRREFLEQMIEMELLAQEARRRGYFDTPEVQRARRQQLVRRFLRQRREELAPESFSEEEVRAHFEENRAEFERPEQVRAAHIQVGSRREAERLLEELTEGEEPPSLARFRALAVEHSEDVATAPRGGDLGFFARDAETLDGEPVPRALLEAAFALEEQGAYTREPVRTERGYHLVMLLMRRGANRVELAQVERQVRNHLARARQEASIEALLTELRERAEVEENLELVRDVRVDVPEGRSAEQVLGRRRGRERGR